MSMMQPLEIRPHEFSQTPGVFYVTPGQTLQGMLLEASAGRQPPQSLRVRIGDLDVPRHMWNRVRPKPGTAIQVYHRGSLQGGSARQIIGAAAMLAVGWWAAAAIGALGSTVGGVGSVFGLTGAAGYAAVGGVYMLSSLAVNALTKPPAPGGAQGPQGAWRQLTGSSNQINPWGVIPFVIGESRFYPPHAALPYTEAVGENSYQVCMFDLGHGDLEVPVEEIKIGNTPLSSFKGVQYEITRTPTLYTQDVSQTDVGAEIGFSDQNVEFIRTTASNAKRIALDLVASQGLFGVGTNGKSWPVWIAWRIRYRKVGDTTWLTPPSPRLSDLLDTKPAAASSLAGANFWSYDERKRPFAMGISWEVPEEDAYEVSVTRLGTLRGSDKNAYYDSVTWTHMRSYRPTLPSRTGTTKLVLRIRANDQLNGTLQNLSCVVRQKIKVYNRATNTWSAPQVSLNPAWVVWWLLTECPAYPKHLSANRVHLQNLADYAEFCEEHGFEARGVCDAPMILRDLVNDVLACSLGSLGDRDGRCSVIFDPGNQTSSFTFAPHEATNVRASRVFVRRPHALRVQFINPEAGWEQDEIIVLDDGYSYRGVDARGNPSSAPEPEVFETLQLRFAAGALQAWRVGRYHFAQSKFRKHTYTFDVDITGIGTVRGDCVEVPSDVTEWGRGVGTVVSIKAGGPAGAAALVELDQALATEADESCRIQFRTSTGDRVVCDVVAAGGETNVFALATMPTGVQPGDLAVLGTSERILVPLLITKTKWRANQEQTFTAVEADPRVKPYWSNPPASIVSEISGRRFGQPPKPQLIGVVAGPDSGGKDRAGIESPVVRIGIRKPERLLDDSWYWRRATL